VRWVRGVAEDIAALNLGSWRAVTFGQSFHRVRRLEVAEAVYDLLVPDGSLVLISHHVDGRPRPADPGTLRFSRRGADAHPRLPR
jgi:hypothetical protein